MNSITSKKLSILNSRFSCLDNQLQDRFLSDFERQEIINRRNQIEKEIELILEVSK
jgi:hypothetical protein